MVVFVNSGHKVMMVSAISLKPSSPYLQSPPTGRPWLLPPSFPQLPVKAADTKVQAATSPSLVLTFFPPSLQLHPPCVVRRFQCFSSLPTSFGRVGVFPFDLSSQFLMDNVMAWLLVPNCPFFANKDHLRMGVATWCYKWVDWMGLGMGLWISPCRV